MMLAGLATVQPAQAAPTFGSATTFGTINQDNGYGSFVSDDGLLVVIAHWVDTSGTIAVEISTDGGASFVTRPTGCTLSGVNSGKLRVAAASSTSIVVIPQGRVGDTTLQSCRTSTGTSWTTTTVAPNNGFSSGGSDFVWTDIDVYGTTYIAVANECGASDCLGSAGMDNVVRRSTDSGATWAGLTTFQATILGAGGSAMAQRGVTISMQSATAWTIFNAKITSGSNSVSTLVRYVTTNTGSSYTTTTINDAFTPLSSWGYNVKATPDGTGVAFTSSTTIYVGQQAAGDNWYFSAVRTGTLLNTNYEVFSCGSKIVGIFQGLNGDDRMTYAEAAGGGSTLTAVTGTTSAVFLPFAAYLRGSNITVVYGNLADGRTAIQTTTNSNCAQAAVAVDDDIAAAATASVTGLVGFDVDPAGVTAIARTDFGETVEVYPAGTLTSPATKDTDCLTGVLAGGVATMRDHVAYFDCDGDNNVVQVEIRSPSLTSPSKASAFCAGAGFCIEDIPTECGVDPGIECIAGDQDNDQNLAIVEDLPIDYSRDQDGAAASEAVYVGMAFADTDGRLGVWTYSMNNNADDESQITSVGIANQAPDQICSHRDPNGVTYLYGSSYTSNVQGFRVQFTFSGGNFGSADDTVTPTMTSIFPGTGATAGPNGVSCGDYRLAILNDEELTVWGRAANGLSSAPLLTQPLPDVPPLSGVASSYNGEFTAYAAGTKWYVIYSGNNVTAIDGEILCQGDLPSGTFVDMKLHGAGSSLWVASSTTIARFDTSDCTTGEDTVFNPIDDPNDIDGDGIDNEGDPDIDGDFIPNDEDSDDDGDGIPDIVDNEPSGPGGGGSSTGGGLVPEGGLFGEISGTLFMGFLLIFGVVWMGIRQGAPGVAIGALFFIGLGLAYAIGWMPIWMIVVMTLLSVGASFLIPKSNASGGLA